MTFPDNEPLVTGATVVALVTAILACAVAFGAPISTDQREAILGVVGVVAPIAVALLVRSHVTPTLKVNADTGQSAPTP